MTMTHGSELPSDSGEDAIWLMTMSLPHGILLTSLNDDVISGMHCKAILKFQISNFAFTREQKIVHLENAGLVD
jgi:hypothetical protein